MREYNAFLCLTFNANNDSIKYNLNMKGLI